MMALGSWLSGYFIIVTNAFMQHPVGHAVSPSGALQLADFWGYLLNPWAIWQYAHTMSAAVITGSFVVAALGAYSLLRRNASNNTLSIHRLVQAVLKDGMDEPARTRQRGPVRQSAIYA